MNCMEQERDVNVCERQSNRAQVTVLTKKHVPIHKYA